MKTLLRKLKSMRRKKLRIRPVVRGKKKLLRIKRKWTPAWEDYVSYAARFCKERLWRFQPYMDLDDLLQEAWVIFEETRARYPRAIDPPHFMSLYKLVLISRFNSMSLKRSLVRFMTPNKIGGGNNDDVDLHKIPDPRCNDAFDEVDLDLLISQAPSSVAAVIRSIRSLPEYLLGFLKNESIGFRETIEDRFQRLAGFPGGRVTTQVADFFHIQRSNEVQAVRYMS